MDACDFQQHHPFSSMESENYAWDPKDFLGKGTFGRVYKGFSKRNGEPVAVKVLTEAGAQVPIEIQERESSILRKLDHPNIVKVFAIENFERYNYSEKSRAIIMELCEGSLVDVLKNPQNYYGLPEPEFLLILKHFTAGLKYLRQQKIVHRDLKPGNILKFVGDDGESIYKLADFGAAKELPNNEEFQSIVGTSEYVHPDLYIRAWLQNGDPNPHRKFTASTDLWSVGVTLYEVATGKLPFEPLRNKSTRQKHVVMYNMTGRKPSGVISAKETENGQIKFRSVLPSTCLMGRHMKKLITPLLAHLMEADKKMQITYDEFFTQSEKIYQMANFPVFYVNKCTLFNVYIDTDSENGYTELLKSIEEETELSVERQLILYKGETLTTLLQDGKFHFTEIPWPTTEHPLVLCDRESSDVVLGFKTLSKDNGYRVFPNLVDSNVDGKVVADNRQLAHDQYRQIEQMFQIEKLIHYSVRLIHQVVTTQLTLVSMENEQTKDMKTSIRNQLSLLKEFNSLADRFVSLCVPLTQLQNLETVLKDMKACQDQHEQRFDKVAQNTDELKPLLNHLLANSRQNRSLLIQWEKDSAVVLGTGNYFSRRFKIASSLLQKINKSYNYLAVHDYTKSDHRAAYLMERIKMSEKADSLHEIFVESLTALEQLVGIFSDWYKTGDAALKQPEILAKDMRKLKEELKHSEKELNKAVAENNERMRIITDHISSMGGLDMSKIQSVNTENRTQSGREMKRLLKEKLQELLAQHDQILEMGRENTQLCDSLYNLPERKTIN